MAKGRGGYVIDACALGDLSGENRDTPFTLDDVLRERVWQGLKRLIEEGRLVTSSKIRPEMKKWHPLAYRRLQPFKGSFFLRDSPEILGALKAVFAVAEQRTRRYIANRAPNKEVADPYLIAIAMLRGYEVVTSEKARSERPANRRKEENIPDWASKVGVKAIHLDELVRREGLG
jgi:hypothetical protein